MFDENVPCWYGEISFVLVAAGAIVMGVAFLLASRLENGGRKNMPFGRDCIGLVLIRTLRAAM